MRPSVFTSNLLRQGAAVLFRHAFPHRLLDRLDLLAQRDARRGGRFDHFSVYGLLLFILRLEEENREVVKKKKGYTEK